MSRYNWYDLIKNKKIVGGGGALGQSGWRDDEIFLDYVTIYLDMIENGSMDEFELIRSGHESGPVEPIFCGVGVTYYSKTPPKIEGNKLSFEHVVFKRKQL